MSKPDIHSLKQPVHFLALGFGSGLAPKAPGTFGTLAALPIFYLLSHFSQSVYVAVTIIISLIGFWICGESARRLGVHDHPAIVWDEIAGYLITMLMVPATWTWMVAGFVLFRLFDILKPWPISWLDRNLQGGTGIMVDDMVAGLFACLVIHGVMLWL